jgi:hypothetical protein
MCNNCGRKSCECKPYPNPLMSEHDKVRSRITGRQVEIGMTPGAKVPKNPFASLAQEGFLHAHPEKLGKAGLAEWDKETKGKKLPKKVK